jgi:uncharacterized integral membrane protein
MDKGNTKSAARGQFRGTGLYWPLILTLVVAIAIVIGIIQNSEGIRLRFLAWTGNLSLAVALLATVVLTVALSSLVGVIWRRRRRRELSASVELRELRGQVQPAPLAARAEDVPAPAAALEGRSSGASR